MRVLITRHQDEALHTASALLAMGISCFKEPLFDIIDHIPVIEDIDTYQAAIFTSRNAARVFRTNYPVPKIPAFCVGDQTATLLHSAGFSEVHSANGTALDLVELVNFKCAQHGGTILRLWGERGGEMASDPLADKLLEAGYILDPVTLYAMKPHDALSFDTQRLLQDKAIDGISFFSPRTAQHFAALAVRAGLTEACRDMTAWCISKKTAASLAPLSFKTIEIAAHPTQQALLDVISSTKI